MIARDVEAKIVSCLAKGFDVKTTASRTGQDPSVVRAVGERHGHPDLGALERAAAGLVVSDRTINGLMVSARKVPELVALVGTVEAAVADLREAWRAHRDRDKLYQELVSLEAEVEQRQRRVEHLRQQLAPQPAVVRAWAAAHKVDCPATGRVPKRVLDAYTKAVHRA